MTISILNTGQISEHNDENRFTEQKIQLNLSVTVSNLDSNRKHDGEDDISVTTDSGLDEGRSLYLDEL